MAKVEVLAEVSQEIGKINPTLLTIAGQLQDVDEYTLFRRVMDVRDELFAIRQAVRDVRLYTDISDAG